MTEEAKPKRRGRPPKAKPIEVAAVEIVRPVVLIVTSAGGGKIHDGDGGRRQAGSEFQTSERAAGRLTKAGYCVRK